MTDREQVGPLPCPFCGETENMAWYGSERTAWWIECNDCDGRGPQKYERSNAVTAWNRRAAPPAAGAGEGTEDVLAGHGCGDGYCDITGPATGMHTNGGCKCLAPLPMSRRTHVRVALQRYREAPRAALAVPREQEPASEARKQFDTIMAEMSLSACIHGVPHVRAEACPDCAASTESEPAYVLEFCKSVIQDAIGLDDGLDGEAGTAVLAMIRNALARGAVPRGEGEREHAEAEAWKVIPKNGVPWYTGQEEDATGYLNVTVADHPRHAPYTVIPLYRHPAPAQPAGGEG